MNESLGTYLKRSREEKNVSIEQVAYATRISLKMLRALEDDQHTLLPAPTFIRGYLQAYAKYVRLDTQDLMLRYQHHLATAPDSKRGAIRSHYLYVRERYQEKRRLVLVIVLFATMLSVAGTYFFLKAQRDKHKRVAKAVELMQKSEEQKLITPYVVETENSKEMLKTAGDKPDAKAAARAAALENPAAVAGKEKPAKPAEATPEKKTVTPPAPPPVAVVAPVPAAPAPVLEKPMEVASSNKDEKRTYNLLLRAQEDAWFRFQTDQGEVKDLTLRAGKAMMLRADTVIKIFSGNLGGLKATLNGKEIPALATGKGTKSVVLPESEVGNYKLPLFPQFQVKPVPKPVDATQGNPPNASGNSAPTLSNP